METFTEATTTTLNFAIHTPQVNITAPSWDTFLLLAFVGGTVIYSFFVSRERLAIVLLSVYSALAVVLTTPLLVNAFSVMNSDDFFKYRLGAFIGGFLLLYALYSHNLSLRADIGHAWWQAVLLSSLQVGLFMSSILYFIPKQYFTSIMAELFFTGDIARSVWILAPIGAMIIMRPHKHEGK